MRRRNLAGIMQNLQPVTVDTLLNRQQEAQIQSLRSANMKRIIVDLYGLFEKKDSSRDIVLRGGDHVYVPSLPSGVHVLGAVASSGTIKFTPDKSYKFYLHHAGGMVKSADKKEIRIVKPDGRVLKDDLSRIDVEIGDTIVVPKKIERDHDWWKIVTNSFAIVSSAVTTAYLIIKL